MKVNCIIVDDEPLALELIESYVNKVPYLNLRGSFHNAVAAINILKEEKIDLMYLDVNMPDISGIDFFKGLKDAPRVIFITAYDQFAVQGFEVNALDYLLKPVSFNRFLTASDRAYAIVEKKEASIKDYILVKSEHHILKIFVDSIYYIEGYKDYLKIYTDAPAPILTITSLKAIEDLLPANFIRVHRSYIISINKIISFRGSKVLIKGKQIPISDSYSEVFHRIVVQGRLNP